MPHRLTILPRVKKIMSKRERSPSRDSPSPGRDRAGSVSTVTREKLVTGPVVLHISDLSRNVTDEYLSDIFSHFGVVKRAVVVIDRKVNMPKGFGFVEYNDLSDAICAVTHMHGGQIDGSSVKVSFVGSDRIPRRPRTMSNASSSPSPTRSVSPTKLN